MITDGRLREGLRWGRIAGAIALVIVGLLAVIVTLTFGSAPGKSMAVIGAPSQALAAIAKANGRILASNSYFTIARSDDAGDPVLARDDRRMGGAARGAPRKGAEEGRQTRRRTRTS